MQIKAQLLQTVREATSQPGRPVSRHLVAFASALMLPALVFAAIVLWQFADRERARLEAGAVEDAREIAASVDRELAGLATAVEMLALSPMLRAGDLAAFHAHAVELRQRLGLITTLRDATGQVLVSSLVPWGAPLPRSKLPLPNATSPARPWVSELFLGAVSGSPQVAVQVIVPPADAAGLPAILALSVPVGRMQQILAGHALPEGWIVAVVDANGVLLARNLLPEAFVGRRATSDLLANTSGQAGTWYGQSLEGTRVLGAYARSALSGWRIAVGVPQDRLAAPVRRSLWLFGSLGAGLLVLGALLAMVYGRRVADAMRQLASAAAALGRGEEVRATATRISEAATVGNVMAGAARALRQRELQLTQLNAELENRVQERTAELEAVNAKLVATASEREQAEAQLRQSQKMEAVGRLTGGVAHDFNNLLTVVQGNLALARKRMSVADERAIRAIDHAGEGARRAAELTQRLLAFSRQQPLAPVAVDANRLVAGMSNLLRRTLGEDVQIETVLAAGLWRAKVDPNQLESTLLNLAVNARDAMPAGGRLTIETGNAWLDEAYAATREDVTPGRYVLISVSDTGVGMTADIASRAFEPFFTTKPVGKGTGLGLSHVYGFAKQSGGHAAIYSEPGHGTTMRVYLPRTSDSEPAGPQPDPAQAAPIGTDAHPGRGELILVAEDEPLVSDFAVASLEEAGWRVVSAKDGPGALALLEAHPDIALLFTDVVLTGPMNGRALADQVLERRPGLPVLFTTGYTRNAIIHHGTLDEGVNFLGKPYAAAILAARVRALLDA